MTVSVFLLLTLKGNLWCGKEGTRSIPKHQSSLSINETESQHFIHMHYAGHPASGNQYIGEKLCDKMRNFFVALEQVYILQKATKSIGATFMEDETDMA